MAIDLMQGVRIGAWCFFVYTKMEKRITNENIISESCISINLKKYRWCHGSQNETYICVYVVIP